MDALDGPASVVNVLAYGAKGDGQTDDTAALQHALDSARGGTVYLPAGNYRTTGALRLPPLIDVRGAGMNTTTITAMGSINGIEAVSETRGYDMAGRISDLKVQGGEGARIGILLQHRQHGTLERVRVAGFARQSIVLDATLMMSLRDCLVQGGGDPEVASIEVDHSTTFHWYNARVSGANRDCVAGLRIDRTTPFTILGGALETCGIPLQLGAKPEARAAVGPGAVIGLDIENPVGAYVDTGSGWQGRPGQGVRRVSFTALNCTPSGARSVPRGLVFRHSDCCHVAQCNIGVSPGGTLIALEGRENYRFSAGVNGPPDSSHVYILEGDYPSPAHPGMPWTQGGAAARR